MRKKVLFVKNLYLAEIDLIAYTNEKNNCIHTVDDESFFTVVDRSNYGYEDVFTGKKYSNFYDFTFDQLKSSYINSYLCTAVHPIEKFLDKPTDTISLEELKEICTKLNKNKKSKHLFKEPFLYLIYMDYLLLKDYDISEDDKEIIKEELYTLAERYISVITRKERIGEINSGDILNVRRYFVMELSQIENKIVNYQDINSKNIEDDMEELKMILKKEE